jgi:hypothetical protein
MKQPTRLQRIGLDMGLILFLVACTVFGSQVGREPKQAVAPLVIGADLASLDVCKSIPVEDIEAVVGGKLGASPQSFVYYDTPGSSGCSYDAGKDPSGNAFFGYVVLTPVSAYGDQPLYKDVAVDDLGEEAYFNNGADARQLWVKVNTQLAFVVAFGDAPNEDGARAIAKLVLTAIRTQ